MNHAYTPSFRSMPTASGGLAGSQTQVGVVQAGQVRETGDRADASLGPIRGLAPVRFRWSLISTRSPGARSSPTPPAALVSTTVSAPEATAVLHPEDDLIERPALVVVDSPGQHHDVGSADVGGDQAPGMALDFRHREAGNPVVGDLDRIREGGRVVAQPGAEHQGEIVRIAIRGGRNCGCGRGNLVICHDQTSPIIATSP